MREMELRDICNFNTIARVLMDFALGIQRFRRQKISLNYFLSDDNDMDFSLKGLLN